ncbi:hypothetical protein C8Q74DRAFT_1451228 [Fomes fomentarius]|nr:hypothetical protein C8Q74DRAFT_1451228 [Fomes fomentarius]
MPPSTNKRRKSSKIAVKDSDGRTDESQVDFEGFIIRMPVEVLAMILFYVSSPRDVLALARTSKHFCAILVNNKANDFIWRAARAHCHPQPIPDFTPNFTEASFAAFLFDSKTCEVCQRRTKQMYHSFALRARICDKPRCLDTWRSQVVRRIPDPVPLQWEYEKFLQWIPRMERISNYYENRTWVRNEDWQQAINDYKKANQLGEDGMSVYIREKKAIADRMPVMSEFYRKLHAWSVSYENLRRTVRRRNQEITTTLAVIHGWQTHDLLHAPSYRTLHDAKNRSLEHVTHNDFSPISQAVQNEIEENKEREAARKKERAQQARVGQVRDTYSDMKTKSPTNQLTTALPTLSEFRKLPVVKIFEAAPSGAGAEKRSMRDPARTALAGVLGFPGWKNLSRRKLHPVDRLTARFRCQRCDKVGRGRNVDDGGMDFAAACEHVCPHVPKKRSSSERWSAERFAVDQRAADAISKVLALCGTSSEDVDSVRIASELGDRVQCQVCSLTMDVASVGRHCKRHQDCTFAVVDAPTEPRIEHGLVKRLLSSSDAALDKAYGCRHCVHECSVSKDQPPLRLLTFHGLRSHVKEKHQVASIADEDFFHQKHTPAGSTSSIDTAA